MLGRKRRGISLNPTNYAPAYNGDKFQELVLYVASECAADPRFGATKLNKILFFSDFLAYGQLGKPITGARYQKLDWGPAARAMKPAIKVLEESGAAKEMVAIFQGTPQKRLLVRREPNLSAFTADEIAIVDRVIKTFWATTATRASAFSHEESVGWQLAELTEDIPYQTVFLSSHPPSLNAIERGKALAAEHGW